MGGGITNAKSEISRISVFLKNFIEDNEFSGAVIGVSGGIDSAVVLAILSRTLPKSKIRVLILPERDSNPTSSKHAKLVCSKYGVDCEEIDITPILKSLGTYSLQPPAKLIPYHIKEKYVMKKWKKYGSTYELDIQGKADEEFRRGVAYYRSKHRVRMCKLYLEAERLGYTVVGTTNRTEWLTGFYVKWGDDATDVEPLLHLYKTEVFELARELDVPKEILEKPPSPDLIPGVTDEMALGMKYEEIDEILKAMDEGKALSDFDREKVERVRKLLELGKKRNIRMVSLEREADV